MINIKELSVGNWVNYHIGWEDEETGQIVYESDTKYPVKIEMIFSNCGEGIVQYNDGQNNGKAYDYELFPIEITPEILEKNGFEKREFINEVNCKEEYWIYYDDYYSLVISEINDGLYKVEHLSEELINLIEQLYISYIHQLQNALTLCGINKNIGL